MTTIDLNKFITFHNEMPITPELAKLIHPNEKVLFCVKTLRDAAVFTDKRILSADKQGLMGKQVEYYSIPYKSILTYSIETAGVFDLDSEIRLTIAGGLNIELKFVRSPQMTELLFKVYHTITEFMFG